MLHTLSISVFTFHSPIFKGIYFALFLCFQQLRGIIADCGLPARGLQRTIVKDTFSIPLLVLWDEQCGITKVEFCFFHRKRQNILSHLRAASSMCHWYIRTFCLCSECLILPCVQVLFLHVSFFAQSLFCSGFAC